MIERLVTPTSILDLAMRRCVLGKDTLRLFSIGAKQSTVTEAQPDRGVFRGGHWAMPPSPLWVTRMEYLA